LVVGGWLVVGWLVDGWLVDGFADALVEAAWLAADAGEWGPPPRATR
jgi:hypothetical protein